MKRHFPTFCLLACAFWSDAVHESLRFAAEYSKLDNIERFMAHVNDALDASFRCSTWRENWMKETFVC